jgi:hypothetical protein
MNPIRIEIESVEVFTKSGTSKAGKPFSLREQKGQAWLLDEKGQPRRYPQEIRFILEGEQAPYPVGMYALDLSSLYVGRFGNLEVGNLRLSKVQQVPAARAA